MNLYLASKFIINANKSTENKLIDLALMTEDNKMFFAKFIDVDFEYKHLKDDKGNEFIKNVAKLLKDESEYHIPENSDCVFVEGNSSLISDKLYHWLSLHFAQATEINNIVTYGQFEEIELLKDILLRKDVQNGNL